MASSHVMLSLLHSHPLGFAISLCRYSVGSLAVRIKDSPDNLSKIIARPFDDAAPQAVICQTLRMPFRPPVQEQPRQPNSPAFSAASSC
jgi:hypothetical protein